MSADIARGHDGDGGGDDRPPTHHIPTGCEGCFVHQGKGIRKPNLGGRKAGMLHTRQETRNLGLKKITDDKGPVSIRFEWDDKKIMMPLGDHASHWSNYLGELIREIPLYYPSWQKVSAERKATIVTKIGIVEAAATSSTPRRVCPYTEVEIMANLRKAIKLCAPFSVLVRRCRDAPHGWMSAHRHQSTVDPSADVKKLQKINK
ncbi:hypothetical protein Tco_0126635 [Tanacetum coccineum]